MKTLQTEHECVKSDDVRDALEEHVMSAKRAGLVPNASHPITLEIVSLTSGTLKIVTTRD